MARLVLVQASDHQLERNGIAAGRSFDGWSHVPGDPGAAAVAARCPAYVIDDGPTLTVYGPDGSTVGPLDGLAGDGELERAAAVAGRTGAEDLLRAALDPRNGDSEVRLADLCRVLGVPLPLVYGDVESDAPAQTAARPDVGVALMHAPAAAVAANAPLTGQSAWTVPLGTQWSWVTWDGDGTPASLPAVAAGLSSGEREPVLAYWWSGQRAGFVLAVKGHLVAAHEWGAGVTFDIEATAPAAEALSREFRVPEQRFAITALLRRGDADPQDLLRELLVLLRAPADLVGLDWAGVTERAAGTRGALRTPKLSVMRAIGHAVREQPTATPLERVMRERPPWYRGLSLAAGVAMALSTAIMVAARLLGARISGWWLAVGVVTTAAFLWDVRPRRKR